jgi:hypothetical protein
MNRIVARFQDGRVLKGHSEDFLPAKGRFHLTPIGAAPEARPIDVSLADLKAVFFVRDFEGDKSHVDLRIFDPSQPVVGRKLRVLFIVPADTTSNIERAYVVAAATREVTLL